MENETTSVSTPYKVFFHGYMLNTTQVYHSFARKYGGNYKKIHFLYQKVHLLYQKLVFSDTKSVFFDTKSVFSGTKSVFSRIISGEKKRPYDMAVEYLNYLVTGGGSPYKKALGSPLLTPNRSTPNPKTQKHSVLLSSYPINPHPGK